MVLHNVLKQFSVIKLRFNTQYKKILKINCGCCYYKDILSNVELFIYIQN
jgi:hypothetical protein